MLLGSAGNCPSSGRLRGQDDRACRHRHPFAIVSGSLIVLLFANREPMGAPQERSASANTGEAARRSGHHLAEHLRGLVWRDQTYG